jgi:membrane associated rhomboid family serine protease
VAEELPTWVEVQRFPSRKRSQEHALVLEAMAIENGVLEQQGSFLLLVRLEDAGRAVEELERYARENRDWPPRDEPLGSWSDGLVGAAVFCGILILLHVLEGQDVLGLDWWRRGAGSAGLERAGQWWRAFTGLTLHVDLPHLLSNLVFGALFVALLCEMLGAGVGLFGTLLAGALGNAANALLHSPEHTSVGASTAVFAALGILVAYQWRRRQQLRHRAFRRWAPLLAGLFLLAELGLSGGAQDSGRLPPTPVRTDFGAHATGFVAGAVLGLLLGRWRVASVVPHRVQNALLVAGPLLIGAAWYLAIA